MVNENATGRRKDKVMLMIEEIMEEYNIDPKSVPTGKKGRVVQYCHGNFTCPNCTAQTWRSSWSWILFDLRNQRIRYRFHQKCACCKTPAQPYLEDEKMRKLVEKVCKKYLRRINEPATDDEVGPIHPQDDKTELQQMKAHFQGLSNSSSKHRPKLCEKCGYGHMEPCYVAVLKKYRDYFKANENGDSWDTPEE